MRLFEREGEYLRECGYQDYLRFYNTDNDPKLSGRYLDRARRLEAMANLLDPVGYYPYHTRRYCETYPEQEDGGTYSYDYDLYYHFRPKADPRFNVNKN